MADAGIASNPETSIFGIKLAFAVAGFWGGVVSLSFVKNLTPKQGVLAVLTGIASAGYGTPIAAHYVLNTEPSSAMANAIAFVLGLTAMNLIPGIVRLSEIWKKDPLSVIKGTTDESGK